MKIELDLGYDDAVAFHYWLCHIGPVSQPQIDRIRHDVLIDIDSAIINEDERRGMAHAESLMESGGMDDSQYRQDMKDAGRGHLLR